MAITTEQRDRMKKFIGASRIAAVLGKDPWKTGEEVRLEMLGQIEPQAAGPKARIGTYLEPSIMKMISDSAGVAFAENPDVLEFFAPNGVMMAHPDGITVTRSAIAEAKYSHRADDWGDSLDHNGLPLRVLLQVVGQFACIPDVPVCYVGALLIDGDDAEFKLYTVQRPTELVEEVSAAVVEWHERHIVRGEVCGDAPKALEALKRVNRDPEAIVTVPSVLLDTALHATEARKLAEKAEEAAFGELYAAMGEASRLAGLSAPASAAEDGTGRRFWLKTENAGMRVDTERFKTEFPDVYAALAAPATRKMPRWYGLPKGEKGGRKS